MSAIGEVSNVLRSPNNFVIITENKSMFCTILFINFWTNSLIKKCWCKITKANYLNIKLKLFFLNSLKVGCFFKFKDCAPTSLVRNAAYLFRRGQCSGRYIGETSHLHKRISDHKGILSRTDKQLLTQTSSLIREHSYFIITTKFCMKISKS